MAKLEAKELEELIARAGLSVDMLAGLAAYCEKGGCQRGCPSGCAPSCSTCSSGKSNGVSDLSIRELSGRGFDELVAALQQHAHELTRLARE